MYNTIPSICSKRAQTLSIHRSEDRVQLVGGNRYTWLAITCCRNPHSGVWACVSGLYYLPGSPYTVTIVAVVLFEFQAESSAFGESPYPADSDLFEPTFLDLEYLSIFRIFLSSPHLGVFTTAIIPEFSFKVLELSKRASTTQGWSTSRLDQSSQYLLQQQHSEHDAFAPRSLE